MRSSMRLAVFLFVYFTISTAFSTYRNNSVAREHEKAIPSQVVDVSDESPPANNSLLTRRFKRQPSWCESLTNQPTEDVIANCTQLKGSGYVLQIKNVDEKLWKTFIVSLKLLEVDVEIIDSSIKEFTIPRQTLKIENNKITISNNPSLQSINLFSTYIYTKHIEIKDNPMLSSVTIDASGIFQDKITGAFHGSLTVSNNNKLSRLALSSPDLWANEKGNENMWLIENNPTLRTLELKFDWLLIEGKFHIVNNKGLYKLNFPASFVDFGVSDLKISNNNRLEIIRIPDSKKAIFCINTLEISQNPALTSIKFGHPSKWRDTKFIIDENQPLSSATWNALDNIKRYNWLPGVTVETGASFLLLLIILGYLI